jgi:hypothetical protein
VRLTTSPLCGRGKENSSKRSCHSQQIEFIEFKKGFLLFPLMFHENLDWSDLVVLYITLMAW